jgi:hypothetical protein
MADQPQHDLLPRRTSKREEGGVFFKKERERGTREEAGKLKRGKVFLNKGEGNGKEAKGRKGPRGQGTLKEQGGEM